MTQSDAQRVPVVGIGASAGGIEAFELLFRAMPPALGAALVIVTHLNPKRESMLPTILQRWTPMPVLTAEDDLPVQADHVYVMPENAALTIRGGRLRITRPHNGHRESQPIDLFLSALAVDQGEFAAAIILSGGDGDGTLGAKAVKEHGGLTMAQTADGTAPQHPSMPQTAIATGLIDFAVPVQHMPEHLVAFVATLRQLVPGSATARDGGMEGLKQYQAEIYALLDRQIGHDFSGYKTKTFSRRIRRRAQLLQIDGIEAYVARLRKDPSEVAALFRDLLINVTDFFRDVDAFDALAQTVIPSLFSGEGHDDTIRVWVPGCATGEEVYSIAILLREHMDGMETHPRAQIFATDIDERSLSVARAARYPEPLLAAVSPERRRRFFTQEGSSYTVTKEVRELCIFSPHSLIRDPPFSRMNLISCRNLLIYLAPDLQGQVLPLFHYSLRPQGYLFLGTSENIGQFSDLFAPLDKKQRIFRSRATMSAGLHLPLLMRNGKPDRASDLIRAQRMSSIISLRQDVESRVLERFAPAHVVINADGDIVLYSSRTGKYLEAAAGVPTRQLLGMARKGLRLELRAAIREAVTEQRRTCRLNVAIDMDDGRVQGVDLTVEPLDLQSEEPLFIVLFQDAGSPLERQDGARRANNGIGTDTSILEHELSDTRNRLQSMIEEYETALEELKSSNEELVSVNEELQSTNEELEASKEELQSLNEELQTVNAELGHKIDELDRSNNDLRNLFDSSKIATIFLKRDLTIRNFTPLAAEIFNLVPGDRGRSLTTFSSKLDYAAFFTDLAKTMQTGIPIETQVDRDDGRTRYLVRVQPYRGEGGEAKGATVTFVDVTSLVSR